MADTEQGDGSSKDGESFADTSNNSPVKRGRGRPQGSKKLKVCVTDINLMEMVSGISNGDSTQTKRGRGRPKFKEETVQEQSGDDDAGDSVQTHRGKGRPKGSKKLTSNRDNPMTDHSKKRGRPKKSLSKSSTETATADLANGGSGTPKLRRGRPKGSTKQKSENLTSGDEDESSFAKPRKRGRPKGSPNKVPRLLAEVSSDGETEGSLSSPTSVRGRLRKSRGNYSGSMTQQTSNAITNTAGRGRGRPRKSIQQKNGDQQNGSQIAKRGRGRPKGSLNKKYPASRLHGNVGQLQGIAAPSKGKRGRPRLQPAKTRGRPRKYPLPSPEDLKRPRVWKPLGRPRKYPRSDPPDDASSLPRRSRGRPRKSESKKGAHLRKNMPTTPASTYNLDDDDDDEPPKKRGRPPSATKSHNATPRKRGRPKGSLNKKKVNSETQLNNTHSHTKEVRELSAVGVEYEGVSGEEVVEHDKDTETAFVKQNKNFDVSNQA
ncbi:hypothetical protein JOB18_002045 [Solea senegalensis]|uniref:Origin recognition complex subunit 4-like n=1 Tax=Solea senegalensis TaxID=28829 RepID=A0AAV6R3B2_SOLSE|nr:chromosomal protein D1 [Solea senegalensis]KAG7499881.1 origin recognition complex subunit 4-like [Solea senegalensis]KAG7499882.1 hypothetical protein JOB18_002045 [Solea senegalensis]